MTKPKPKPKPKPRPKKGKPKPKAKAKAPEYEFVIVLDPCSEAHGVFGRPKTEPKFGWVGDMVEDRFGNDATWLSVTRDDVRALRDSAIRALDGNADLLTEESDA